MKAKKHHGTAAAFYWVCRTGGQQKITQPEHPAVCNFSERSVFWIVWNIGNEKAASAVRNGVPHGGSGLFGKHGYGRRSDAPHAGAGGTHCGHQAVCPGRGGGEAVGRRYASPGLRTANGGCYRQMRRQYRDLHRAVPGASAGKRRQHHRPSGAAPGRRSDADRGTGTQ